MSIGSVLSLIRRSLRKILETPLPPPSEKERELINELRRSIRLIPALNPTRANSLAEKFWMQSRIELRNKLIKDDPRKFLTWDTIKKTMFVSSADYINTELDELRRSNKWPVWERAISETYVGLPDRYPSYKQSSGNLIHHAFSLSQFEGATGQHVDSLNLVVEFGGGYGSMCRLIQNLGFSGSYFIFDLPELSALQTFFLESNGIPVVGPEGPNNRGARVYCVSELNELTNLIGVQSIDLLIATWSISEAPQEIREEFLSKFRASNYLIGFQDRFEDIDNTEFFSRWSARASNVNWATWAIPHLQGQQYLVGTEFANRARSEV